MDTKYRSKGHCKFLLRYHLILVCKYRLKLMSASNISSDIKKLSEQIAKKHNVDIWYLESDKDHIHYMIEVEPNTNLANYRGLYQSANGTKINADVNGAANILRKANRFDSSILCQGFLANPQRIRLA